ncbi:hypothetical protein [Methylobacterium sp. SyP6R]|uniref:hypothetical protein n=1 Tax=Methylobacterium sp. SyP6R TaxID=2718876 RepID=UPI001F42AF1D|nr:hypothetical protein [Methylobacterium sp. SyP6R]MCF4129002.1 hypothetical protein [Methylobacterium sp. SyP6R]
MKIDPLTSHSFCLPVVSVLKTIFASKQGPTLHQAKIDATRSYEDFQGFVRGFQAEMVYPSPQASKVESYGWTPVAFEAGYWTSKSRPDATPKWGTWRVGSASTGRITLLYGDIDNDGEGEWVTVEDVVEALTALGLSHLVYTSYSHLRKEAGKHKIRFITPISRPMSYDEARQIALVFHEVFRRQADLSIYDPGDFLYGPPHGGVITAWTEGLSLDVDGALGLYESLDGDTKALIHPTSAAPARPLTPEEAKAALEASRDASIRQDISIRNPAVFNPRWFSDLYGLSKGGSHSQTLLSVLTKVYVKTNYSLSFGELRSIQRELDAEWGFYCDSKYGKAKMERDVKSVLRFRGSQSFSNTHPNTSDRDRLVQNKLRSLSNKF